MFPETGSLLLLILFCAGATAFIPITEDPTEDKEALARPGIPWEKLGTCPKNVDYPVNGPMLTNDCRRDKDCKGKRKCCFSGGRRQCLLPLDAKKDACPYFNHLECITIKPPPAECHSDDQCQGTERCCDYGCRSQCMPTVKVKPGVCPPTLARCSYPPPAPKCKSDSECTGKMKCCTPFCGLQCTDPLPQ